MGFSCMVQLHPERQWEDNPNLSVMKANYKEEFDQPPFIQKMINTKFTQGNSLRRHYDNYIVY